MRTKTLLLFVFLLTGMAFSQDDFTDRTIKGISFDKITWLLTKPESVRTVLLKDMGYETESGIKFRKGFEEFEIIPEPDGKSYSYWERNVSSERRNEIRTQANNAGLKERKSDPFNRDIFLEGNGFSVLIKPGPGITIKRLK